MSAMSAQMREAYALTTVAQVKKEKGKEGKEKRSVVLGCHDPYQKCTCQLNVYGARLLLLFFRWACRLWAQLPGCLRRE
jgi:hypothetical protein